jgi:hypothetical protein
LDILLIRHRNHMLATKYIHNFAFTFDPSLPKFSINCTGRV